MGKRSTEYPKCSLSSARPKRDGPCSIAGRRVSASSKREKAERCGQITRREFLRGSVLSAAGLALTASEVFSDLPQPRKTPPPNLLFIHTDQQHFEAISALGCLNVKTPNIDRLVRRGITFSNSYSANPICCPARACWYTGRASSENGVLSNQHRLCKDVPDLGQWFAARGYLPVYSGKWHVPGRDAKASFTSLLIDPSGQGEQCDSIVSRSGEAFLRNYTGDKPFFLSLGFVQPHDCCYWRFAHRDDIGSLPYPTIEKELPKLPENFDYSTIEPPTMKKHLEAVRNGETPGWSKLHWQYYLWSYYRMVEMVDAEIGRVLDALDESGFVHNTLIIFTADHGDGLARHRSTSKWFLYDEAVRVPFIACLPGVEKDGRINRSHVISGLDIVPTLCDFAGIEAPPNCRGRSLRPLLEGSAVEWREFVVSECNITGRMVRTPEYKLITYKDESPDLLFDMRNDPLEMRNLALDPKSSDILAGLKSRLSDWESKLVPPAGA